MDIIFYDLDLNKLRVLPASSKNTGHMSMNAKIEFRGNGSLLLLFYDEELKPILRQHPEGMILKYGDFEGFITDYQFKEHEMRVYGSHLNYLLHRGVIKDTLISTNAPEDAETVIYRLLEEFFPWISLAPKKGGFKEISYDSDVYKLGDEVISEIAKRADAGYRISLDIPNKAFVFEMLPSFMNPLMLSKDNLNAYDIQEDFDSKDMAFGGWYKNKAGNWRYIQTADKTGIRIVDVVLRAETEEEAMEELIAKVSELQISAKTKDVAFNKDYVLGDIIRVRQDGFTDKKLVSGIELWHEDGYMGEQPILENYTETV